MHRRTSSRGLRHFVHSRRGDCTSAPESWQHLAAKDAVAKAVQDCGWKAEVEADGDGWIADVLATCGNGMPVAFEIQWTRQTPEEHRLRTLRYLDSGVRPVWLRRPSAREETSFLEEPPYPRSFTLAVDESGMIYADGRTAHEVVEDVLSRQVVWRRSFPVQQVGTVLVREQPYACPKCRRQAVLPMWHAESCCRQGTPGAIFGPHPDQPQWRHLIARAQQRGTLPNASMGWFEPGSFVLQAKGNLAERTVYGWSCPSCNWVMQLDWCPCCAGIDQPPTPPVGVWQLRCRPATIARLLRLGNSLAGAEHWCTSLTNPATLR